mmetsp:Transcript_8415/g.23175  ORF Transcript_8415/g.23175 Transcript_8415/m.23175 type:complete len:259 (+) Transcript_8415:392-1168(+)
MGVRVHFLKLLAVQVPRDVLREVSLVLGRIFLGEHLHVVLDLAAEDLLLVRIGVVLGLPTFLIGGLEAGELLVGVRDVQATIDRTLEGTPHAVAGGRGLEADIQDALEGPLVVLLVLDVVVRTIDLLLALEGLIKAELFQDTAGHEQASAVGRGVVLVASGDAELGQLSRGRLRHDHVAPDGRVHDLADALRVREAHDEPVLLVVKLVLVLTDHLPARAVVSLALAAPARLDLEPLEISLVLQHLHERHDASFPEVSS